MAHRNERMQKFTDNILRNGNGDGDPPINVDPRSTVENKSITNKLKEVNENYNKQRLINEQKEIVTDFSTRQRYKNVGGIEITSAPHEWLFAGGPVKSGFNLAKGVSSISDKIIKYARGTTSSAGFQIEAASSIKK